MSPRSTGRDLVNLPKAHLHLHLDGALRRDTYQELAAAAGVDPKLPREYGSFDAFSDTLVAAQLALRTDGDLERVIDEIVEDAVSDGAVWLELSVWPGFLRGRLGSADHVLSVVLSSAKHASVSHRIGVGIMVAANRNEGPDEAIRIARLAAGWAGHGVVSFGLDGDEVSAPAERFIEAFSIARDSGLMATPHAGELVGPSSIVAALDALGASRILHGVRAVESSDLLSRLSESDVCLDVCPTSNVLLGITPDVHRHPLPSLLEAGVSCSVNADDPLLFDRGLLDEYVLCRDALGLSDEELASIARTSVEWAAAPSDLTHQWIADIETWLSSGGIVTS